MAFLSSNTFCTPIIAAAAPCRSLLVVRASAKSSKNIEPAVANPDSAHSAGRRHAMVLLAAAGIVTAGSAAVSRSARARPGGNEDIKDVNDPYVREIGNWAVTKYNEETGGKLQFSEVLNGCKQVVAGTNYKLQIKAMGPESRVYYLVEVFDPLPSPGKERQLNLFDGWVGPLPDENELRRKEMCTV